MRNLTRQQVVILILFGTCVVLLAIGFFGGSILGLPRAVSMTAGLSAAVMMFFLIPAGSLYELLVDRRLGAIRYSVLAIKRRWYYAISGGYAAVIGLALLLPSPRTTGELRFAGAILLVWGLLCIWVAVLALRTKRRLADARLTR